MSKQEAWLRGSYVLAAGKLVLQNSTHDVMNEEWRSGLISSMKFTLPEFEIEILVMLIRRLLKVVGVDSQLWHNLTRLTLSPTIHDMKNTIPELTVPITHQPLK